MKKHKKQVSEEKKAINSLSLISQGQTGYLQDWAKINQIREQSIQWSNQLPNNQNQTQRQQTNIKLQSRQTINRKTIFNIKENKMSNSIEGKKYIEARVQNFVTISETKRKNIIKKQLHQYQTQNKSSQNLMGLPQKCKNQAVFDNNNEQEKQQQKISRCENSYRLKPSCSMNYVEKIRKLSLPWLKHIPKPIHKKEYQQEQIKKYKQEAKRLSQIIKNKMGRKRSNKFIMQKQPNQYDNTQQNKKQYQILQHPHQNSNTNEENQKSAQNHEIRLLKNWLELNRYKNKKSVTSLLREHFQNKYFQKKKLREKTMRQQSTKAVSLMAQYNKKFQ